VTDLLVFLAIIVGVELLRRAVVLAIARRIATPQQFSAFRDTYYWPPASGAAIEGGPASPARSRRGFPKSAARLFG
jgi:hypothetical protein